MIVLAIRYHIFLTGDLVYFPQPPKVLLYELYPILISLLIDVRIRKQYLKGKNKEYAESEIESKPHL